jgi:general stress protein 26
MNRHGLVSFIRRHRWGVVSSVSAANQGPQSAVVGVAVSDQLELVFDTLASTRKAQNIRRDPRVSVVVGWDEEQTVQFEGTADEPQGAELAEAQRIYFARFPDGLTRLACPGLTYFRVRATWVRFSDFRAGSADEVGAPFIVERSGSEWGRG